MNDELCSHRRKANRIGPIVSAVCEYETATRVRGTVRSLGICEKAIAGFGAGRSRRLFVRSFNGKRAVRPGRV